MDYKIENKDFDLRKTFFCGQCFRWKDDGDNVFSGVVGKRIFRLRQDGSSVTFMDIDENDIPYINTYFDLKTDYGKLVTRFSEDNILNEACAEGHGIRVLRQEPYETLISFIISQNNNIPRISGIIERLCVLCGEKITDNMYTFPDAKTVGKLDESELAPLRAGFRARYIVDGTRKVLNGDVNFDRIDKGSYTDGKAELMKIIGVGEKVADCVLLFAFGKTEAFPKDVWVKRIMSEYYPDGLPKCVKGYEGIAQQFLFEYGRKHLNQKG